jgi:hypothetical protein
MERFYQILFYIVACVYLLEFYVTLAASKSNLLFDNKYFALQKSYGIVVSGIIKFLLVAFILKTLLHHTLNLGGSAILAAAYLCLSVQMVVDYLVIKFRQ